MATYTSKKAYMYGTGRESLRRACYLFPTARNGITVNGRPLDDYFGLETLKLIVRQPFAATDTMGKFDVEATVTGGGVTGQAGAIRHGIARALLQVEDSYRAPLRPPGLLTRDPRMKEQEIRSQRGARRAPVQQANNLQLKNAKKPGIRHFPGLFLTIILSGLFGLMELNGNLWAYRGQITGGQWSK